MSLVYLAIAWALGIFIAATYSWSPSYLLPFSVAALVAALLLRRNKRNLLLLIGVAFALLGAWRYSVVSEKSTQPALALFLDQDVVATGTIRVPPIARDSYSSFHLDVESLSTESGHLDDLSVSILVRSGPFDAPAVGSRVTISGRLLDPAITSRPSYAAYLRRQGVFAEVNWPSVELLATEQLHPLRMTLFRINDAAERTIARLISEPQASLLSGILLGRDESMPRDLAEAFRATGLSHIVAISGFNITIVAMVFFTAARSVLSHRKAAALAITGIWFYTIFVGAEPSVVRAAVMATILVGAHRFLGRPTYLPATLALAAILMTAVDPNALWDVGFQLSFAATLSLVLFAPAMSRRLWAALNDHVANVTIRKLIGLVGDTLVITVAAQILTLPLVALHFGRISPISLLANLIVVPLQPAIMIVGGMTAIIGQLSLILAQPFAWIVWIFLTATVRTAELLSKLPLATVSTQMSAFGLVAIYAAIATISWLAAARGESTLATLANWRSKLTPLNLAASAGVLSILTFSFATGQPDGKLHVVFLDVGQGDSILVTTPAGSQVLIDGGRYPTVLTSHLGRHMPFWDRQVELVVATHSDVDHVAGLTSVLDRYTVGTLLVNGEQDDGSAHRVLMQLAADNNVAIHEARSGHRLQLDSGVVLRLLNPAGTIDPESSNNNSIVIQLSYGEFDLLLTGDAEAEVEQSLVLIDKALSSEVLKAAHHGSRGGSTADFLDAVAPRVMIVSAGADNLYGHPHEEVLDRAAARDIVVLRTDELGSIEVTTDGAQMWWQSDSLKEEQ